MLHKTLLVMFSLVVPGSGHVCRGRYDRAAAFLLGALLVNSVGVPLSLPLLTAGGLSGAVAVVAGLLLSFGVSLAVKLWAAFDSVREWGEGARPVYLRGVAAVVFYLAVQYAAGQATGLPSKLQRGLREPETAAAPAPVPQGPFASETRGEVFYTREKDSFTLPPGCTAKAGPSFDDADQQMVKIYPHQLYKDLAVGKKTLGELMEAGLVILDILPVPEVWRKEPGYAGHVEELLRTTARGNPAWGAAVEKRGDFPLPGVLLTMKEPPMVRLHLFGKKRYYVLRASAVTPALEGVAQTLEEAPDAENK